MFQVAKSTTLQLLYILSFLILGQSQECFLWRESDWKYFGVNQTFKTQAPDPGRCCSLCQQKFTEDQSCFYYNFDTKSLTCVGFLNVTNQTGDISMGNWGGSVRAPDLPNYGHSACVGPSNCFGYEMCTEFPDMRVADGWCYIDYNACKSHGGGGLCLDRAPPDIQCGSFKCEAFITTNGFRMNLMQGLRHFYYFDMGLMFCANGPMVTTDVHDIGGAYNMSSCFFDPPKTRPKKECPKEFCDCCNSDLEWTSGGWYNNETTCKWTCGANECITERGLASCGFLGRKGSACELFC